MAGIIRFVALLLTFAALGGMWWAVARVTQEFSVDKSGQPAATTRQILQQTAERSFEPGQDEFAQAVGAIAIGDLGEAVAKLENFAQLYPKSPYFPEARRILGEIKLDKILSVENQDNKKRYTVQSGDSYGLIARRNQTTIPSILMVNGLFELQRLHPGDDLLMMPLNFSLKLDAERKVVTLVGEDGEDLKDYRPVRWDIPKVGGTIRQGEITGKSARKDGRGLPEHHPDYLGNPKLITVKVAGSNVQLREAEEENNGRGLFLKPTDLEEISILTRRGNGVALLPGS